jgi:uncharacterized damage-inducible protein DinB
MSRQVLTDAFGHHVWATQRVIDACLALDPKQLETSVPGTYGSIIDTMRHLVASDCGYLFALTGGRTTEIDEDAGIDLDVLRITMEGNGREWLALVAGDIDAEVDVIRHRDDGTDSHAPAGVRFAQALHHGTDHRSQICTALTTLGIEPPEIDVWDFAEKDGRISVTQAAS